MGFHRFEELTWPEVSALDRDRTILFLPVSPIEEHGPHLPLGTDFFAARDIAEAACGMVLEKDPDLEVVLMPVIPLGCCGITADFPGTVSLRGTTMAGVVADVCSSLAKYGFRYIVVSNHHLDPVHVKALLTGIEDVESRYDVRIIETAGRIVYAGMETREAGMIRGMGLDPQKEVHADVRETAFVSVHYPSLLRAEGEEIPPVKIDVEKGMREGLKTFRAMGAEQGYLGSPSMAIRELGRLHLEEGAGLTADLALRLIRGEALPEINDRMKHALDKHIRLD
ncbi:MAG: creatininase family protein [Deltaproteobacteria bacterium]|nr:creatininase family protein [Deltaproteobacteria bacterium]